jgi:prepilin-type N-terminal cleavage/methylation domain-containing protein
MEVPLSSSHERAYQSLLNNNRGFSLLEMIIALLFSSVIIMIIVATMRFAVSSEEKGTIRQDKSQHIRIVTSQLSFFLKGAYPYIAKIDNERQYYFEGETDSVSFITSSVSKREDSLINKPGLKWIKIFRDSEGLKIMENFFFLDEDYEGSSSTERLLDDTVTDIGFEYLDTGEKRDEEPEWSDSWSTDETEYLPAAVKVTLTIQEEDEEIETELPPFTVRIMTSKKVN